MATVRGEELQTEIHGGEDVIDLVSNESTWRDLLIGLVDKNKLDPWNIDIVEIVDRYISTVKALKVMDLRVPANIILAAAILLRLKSNYISLQDYDEIGEMGIAEDVKKPDIIVDPLNLRLRLPPKRKISLTELIAALDEAMEIKLLKESPQQRPSIFVPIKLENFDIEAETERLYGIIKENVDKSNMVTFSYISRLSSINDILLELFIPLLFLAHRGKVGLIQEQFFSEIIIAPR
ncbi:MAG: segregation/condensation protein A [Candidatus Marsarchaeota archaeon]|nr:segregation/condensation protein A [Candidatus Marsarchaeota archaeon]MCL5412901.1 segregation/condensation protein A [Candidatus Marsarchaeota archaeon]